MPMRNIQLNFNSSPTPPDVNIEGDKERQNSAYGVAGHEDVHRDGQGKVEVSDDILSSELPLQTQSSMFIIPN